MKAQQQREYQERDHKQTVPGNDQEAASTIELQTELVRPGAEDHIEALIDEAIEGSYPCSDPPAFSCAKEAVTKYCNRDAMAKKQ